ncbi:MAG: RDD family protein [Mycobacterium sp.]
MLEDAATESADDTAETAPLASWWSRAGAFAVDVPFGLAVVAAWLLAAATVPRFGWQMWFCVGVSALITVLIWLNRWLFPDLTGWSLGRALFGIVVVRRDGERAGVFRLLTRDAAHLLDTAALFVGWLWPLWDSRHRTFADLLLRTEVRRPTGERPDVRRAAAAVLTAGVVLAAASVGLTYLTVIRHEQAVDRARAQVADQGPRIVEQILTYSAGTMKDDFARAQTLVTDQYRDQLAKQQQAVEKNAAASNEYWAVTSSVLPGVTPDRATMLIFLQGQRQAQQQEVRFITATTKVTFEKSHDGRWRVSDLTVLSPPALNRPGQ